MKFSNSFYTSVESHPTLQPMVMLGYWCSGSVLSQTLWFIAYSSDACIPRHDLTTSFTNYHPWWISSDWIPTHMRSILSWSASVTVIVMLSCDTAFNGCVTETNLDHQRYCYLKDSGWARASSMCYVWITYLACERFDCWPCECDVT